MSVSAASPSPGPRPPRVARLDSLKNPQPRPSPWANVPPPKKAAVPEDIPECPNPECYEKDVGEEDGTLVCRQCGSVITDSNIVSELVFSEGAGGATNFHGTTINFDRTYARISGAKGPMQQDSDSRQVSEANGNTARNRWGSDVF